MDDINTFAFDWQELPEGDFLKWMLIRMIQDKPDGWFEELSDLTSGFTDVQMDIQINSKPVPVDQFINYLKDWLHTQGRTAAIELVQQVGFGKIRDDLERIEQSLQDDLASRLRDAEIHIPEREDWR